MQRVDKKLLKTPRRSYFVIIPNILGLQVIRVIYYQLLWYIRRLFRNAKVPNSYASTLDQQGVVIIPDYLSKGDFEAICEDYEEFPFELSERMKRKGPKLMTSVCSTPLEIKNETFFAPLLKNNQLLEIVEYCAAKKSRINPTVNLHYYYADAEDIGIREVEKTDTLHYDVPLKNFRCFYFLDDCTVENAAFEFAERTHKVNLSRLKLEYFDSIKQARCRKGKPDSRVEEIDQKLLDGYGADPKPIEVKANTLVVFNTMGLHRRGRFLKAGSRKAIVIDFRSLDAPINSASFQKEP